MSPDRSTTWHVPGAALSGYARGDVSAAQSWSVEAHLEACAACRAELTRTLTRLAPAAAPGSDPVAALRLAELSGVALASQPLPAQGRVRAGSPARRRRVLLLSGGGAGAAYALAVVLVLGLAAVLDLTGTGPAAAGDPLPLSLLLAPLLPLLGVALAYGPGADPTYELVASTPLGGLPLLLWRTAACLAVAVPAGAAAGLLTGAGVGAAAWLLPCLGLTAALLAVGPVFGLRRTAVLLAGAWSALVLVPWPTGWDTARVLPLTAEAVVAWLLVLLGAGAVVALRPSRYQLLLETS